MANDAFDNYTRQDKSSRTGALNNKDSFKVFSYVQIAITPLHDDNNNFYEHYFNDISSISDRYFSYNSFTDYQKDAKRSLENFFEFKDSLDSSSMFLDSLEKNLNYGNLVANFLNTGTSNFLGKITQIANSNTEKIVEEALNKTQSIQLMSTQTDNMLDNEESDPEFSQLSDSNGFLENISRNNLFIKADNVSEYINTDSVIGQSLLNIALSNKLFFPNTYNTKEAIQVDLRNNIYPYVNIGSNLTNTLDFMSHMSANSFDKRKFSFENAGALSLIFAEDKDYVHQKSLTELGVYYTNSIKTARGTSYSDTISYNFNRTPSQLKVLFLNECDTIENIAGGDTSTFINVSEDSVSLIGAFPGDSTEPDTNVKVILDSDPEQTTDIYLTNTRIIPPISNAITSKLEDILTAFNSVRILTTEYINKIAFVSDIYMHFSNVQEIWYYWRSAERRAQNPEVYTTVVWAEFFKKNNESKITETMVILAQIVTSIQHVKRIANTTLVSLNMMQHLNVIYERIEEFKFELNNELKGIALGGFRERSAGLERGDRTESDLNVAEEIKSFISIEFVNPLGSDIYLDVLDHREKLTGLQYDSSPSDAPGRFLSGNHESRILFYIRERLRSIYSGTISQGNLTLENLQSKDWTEYSEFWGSFTRLYAGQFSDISYENSLKYLEDDFFSIAGNSIEEIPHVTVKRIFDLHCYTYDGKVNKQINNIRNNFIEPCNNTLDEKLFKLDIISLDNEIKKEKAAQNNLDIDEILSGNKKLFNRAKNSLESQADNYSYLYGNDRSSKVLLLSSDDEIENFIQDDIFVNNFIGDVVINDKKIQKTSARFIKNIPLKNQEEYKDRFEKLTKYTSLVYADSIFKNTKTIMFSLLRDVKEFAKDHRDGWIGRKNSTIFQYENFISAVYEKDFNFNESREYTKRLVAKAINDITNVDGFIRTAKVINNVTTRNVVSHNVENILKIDKKNKNSADIFESLYSTENLNKIKKYTLIVYPNIHEHGGDDIEVLNYNNSNCTDLLRKRSATQLNPMLDIEQLYNRFYRTKLNVSELYTTSLKLAIPEDSAKIKVIKQIKHAKIVGEENNEMSYMFSSQCDEKAWLFKSISNEEELVNEISPRYEDDGVTKAYNWSSKKNLDVPLTDYFYDAANKNNTMLNLASKKIQLLIEYLDLDLSKIETYDDILDFIEENNNLLKISHQILSLSAKLFRVVFNRFATISLHNIIADFDNENQKVKGKNITLASKDITYIYDNMMSDEMQMFNSIEDVESNFMEQLSRIVKFKSKDTDILLDAVISCNLHDICKSLTLDILRGYYQLLSTMNNQISDDNIIRSSSSDLLNSYFEKVSDEDVNTFINNEFYQNIISKKLIKILLDKESLQEQLAEVIIDQSSQENKNATKNKKLVATGIFNARKGLINHYIRSKDITADEKYDIIKIGIKFDTITNFSPDDVFEFKVRTIYHNSYRNDTISYFYYSPVFTSYILPNMDIDLASIGSFNVDKNITERFYSVEKENVKNYLKSTGKFDDNHVIINDDMLYENMYSSQFCEAYENIINNVDPHYIYKNESVSDNIIENTYFEDISSIEKEEFIKIFKLDKDILDEYNKQEHFTKTISNSMQVKEKTKSHSVIKYLSENITDIDIYKTLALNQYYDFFNILIPSPKDDNVSYHISVDLA